MDFHHGNLPDSDNHSGHNYPYHNPYGGGGPGGNPYGSSGSPPVKVPGSSLAAAAMAFGIISIISALMMTVYFPFVFGGLAIVFSLLSKGRMPRLLKQAKAGIICAIIGLAANIAIIAGSFTLILSNPDALRQTARMYDTMCEQIYGRPSEDILGDSMEDMVDQLIRQMQ